MRPSCGKVFGVQGSRGGRYGPHPGGSPAWQPSRRGNQSLRSDYAVGDARRRSKTHAVCLSDPRIRCAVHAVDVSREKTMRNTKTKTVLISELLTWCTGRVSAFCFRIAVAQRRSAFESECRETWCWSYSVPRTGI